MKNLMPDEIEYLAQVRRHADALKVAITSGPLDENFKTEQASKVETIFKTLRSRMIDA